MQFRRSDGDQDAALRPPVVADKPQTGPIAADSFLARVGRTRQQGSERRN